MARVIAVAGLALLVERELSGGRPGADDNASGIGVTARLACEPLQRPLASTRVVLLICGCEESGLLGAQAFLREHDTEDWLFVNFDSVGGPGTLRYIPHDGIVQKWGADPALLGIAGRIAQDRPTSAWRGPTAPSGSPTTPRPSCRARRSLAHLRRRRRRGHPQLPPVHRQASRQRRPRGGLRRALRRRAASARRRSIAARPMRGKWTSRIGFHA